jgi:hypothetical protein
MSNYQVLISHVIKGGKIKTRRPKATKHIPTMKIKNRKITPGKMIIELTIELIIKTFFVILFIFLY